MTASVQARVTAILVKSRQVSTCRACAPSPQQDSTVRQQRALIVAAAHSQPRSTRLFVCRPSRSSNRHGAFSRAQAPACAFEEGLLTIRHNANSRRATRTWWRTMAACLPGGEQQRAPSEPSRRLIYDSGYSCCRTSPATAGTATSGRAVCERARWSDPPQDAPERPARRCGGRAAWQPSPYPRTCPHPGPLCCT